MAVLLSGAGGTNVMTVRCVDWVRLILCLLQVLVQILLLLRSLGVLGRYHWCCETMEVVAVRVLGILRVLVLVSVVGLGSGNRVRSTSLILQRSVFLLGLGVLPGMCSGCMRI